MKPSRISRDVGHVREHPGTSAVFLPSGHVSHEQ